MATTLIPVEEYLRTSYPDREYVDGEIRERNIGEPQDRTEDMLHKMDEYILFGVPWVWTVDPYLRTAHIHTAHGRQLVEDGFLRAGNPDIAVPLAELFA